MSYDPIQDKDRVFFTLVRGNSSWNDVIETNSDYIENSGDTIRTKDNKTIPMIAESCISYENNTANTAHAATWTYALNTSDAQFKWGQLRGWIGGSYVMGDDKALSTSETSFTYVIKNSAGQLSSFTRNYDFSSTILYFPESI